MRLVPVSATRSRAVAKDVTLVAAFTLVTIAAAQMKVRLPFSAVPVTLQTLAAVLAGMLIGSRLGALSQLQYMAVGLAGAPVFANPPYGGPAALSSPSFGYIPGFALGAFLAGWSWEKLGRSGFRSAAISAALGAAAVYVAGIPWLTGWLMVTSGQPAGKCVVQAWLTGMAPFVGADAFKVVAAAAIAAGMSPRKPLFWHR